LRSGGRSRLRLNKAAAVQKARDVPVRNIPVVDENVWQRIAALSFTIAVVGYNKRGWGPVDDRIIVPLPIWR
jgi:hypothetical protein